MAKNGKATLLKIIGLCLVAIGMLAATIWAFADTYETAEHAKEAVVELKKDGCDPVHGIDKRCLVLETKWEAINQSQTELKVGQTAILKALEK